MGNKLLKTDCMDELIATSQKSEDLDLYDIKSLEKRFIKSEKLINDDKRNDSDVYLEHNSFLEPLDLDMYRKTNALPPLGYTSVSRIARG